MNLTKGDVAMLGRRQQQPTREPGELLAIFVPGKLVNTLNATGWYWRKRSRWAKDWKERTYLALVEAMSGAQAMVMQARSEKPKHLDFRLHVGRLMDSDAWPGCVKPVRDSLVPVVIHDDGPTSGHVFTYSQVKDGQRGVTVRVRLLERGEAATPFDGETEGGVRRTR